MGDSDGDKGEANSWSQGTQKHQRGPWAMLSDEVVDLATSGTKKWANKPSRLKSSSPGINITVNLASDGG